MFTNLRIQRYRGIRDLSLDSLGRLNLLIGGNGAGKTTVLEALALLGTEGHGGRVTAVASTRAALWPTAGSAAIRDLVWIPMFFDLDAGSPIVIEANGEEADGERLQIRTEPVGELAISSGKNGEPFVPAVEEALVLLYKRGETEATSRVVLGSDDVRVAPPKDLPHARKYAFVVAGGGGDASAASQDAMELGTLRREKQSGFLPKVLRDLDSRIRSVEENSSSGRPAIYCELDGLPRLMSLSSLGGGLTKIARYLLTIATTSGGVVMLDEIENGLHHEALTKAWKAIGAVAKRFDTQLFAMTHSLECIRAAHEALDAEDLRVIRIEREGGDVRARPYSAEALSAAIEFKMEMR